MNKFTIPRNSYRTTADELWNDGGYLQRAQVESAMGRTQDAERDVKKSQGTRPSLARLHTSL